MFERMSTIRTKCIIFQDVCGGCLLVSQGFASLMIGYSLYAGFSFQIVVLNWQAVVAADLDHQCQECASEGGGSQFAMVSVLESALACMFVFAGVIKSRDLLTKFGAHTWYFCKEHHPTIRHTLCANGRFLTNNLLLLHIIASSNSLCYDCMYTAWFETWPFEPEFISSSYMLLFTSIHGMPLYRQRS